MQARIDDNFADEGFVSASEPEVNDRGSILISQIDATMTVGMVRDAAHAKPQAITLFCANMRDAPLVDQVEHEIGTPICDTVATVL